MVHDSAQQLVTKFVYPLCVCVRVVCPRAKWHDLGEDTCRIFGASYPMLLLRLCFAVNL